jgi:hypothetical protein
MSSPFKTGSVSVGQHPGTRTKVRPETAPHESLGGSFESRGGGANRATRPPQIATPKVRRNKLASGWWLPGWVRQLVDSNASVDDLIAEAVRRVVASPHEATLMEIQAVFNELSRDPTHATGVRAAVRALLRGNNILRRRGS